MPEAATESHCIGDARPRSSTASCSGIVRRASRLAGLIVVLACAMQRAHAQLPPSPLPLSNTEDARTLPKGTVLLRALNAWTRLDEVYDAAADSAHKLHPLGDAFSGSAVGVRQYPRLAAAESALRVLTGQSALALSLGEQFATADTRTVTTPIAPAYGLTNRLTIGTMVPVVQTHTTVFVELNPRPGTNTGANVGPNPAQLGFGAAQSTNATLIGALGNAAAALKGFLANCAA